MAAPIDKAIGRSSSFESIRWRISSRLKRQLSKTMQFLVDRSSQSLLSLLYLRRSPHCLMRKSYQSTNPVILIFVNFPISPAAIIHFICDYCNYLLVTA